MKETKTLNEMKKLKGLYKTGNLGTGCGYLIIATAKYFHVWNNTTAMYKRYENNCIGIREIREKANDFFVEENVSDRDHFLISEEAINLCHKENKEKVYEDYEEAMTDEEIERRYSYDIL